MMRRLITLILFTLFLQIVLGQNKPVVNDNENLKVDAGFVPDKSDRNNNFYDNEPVYQLPMKDLYIDGEVKSG